MNVWIVNPFDNLPEEGFRPQRYRLMAEAFVRAGHRVTLWTSDFNHALKTKRKSYHKTGLTCFMVCQIPTLPYAKNVCLARIRSHRQLARDFERLADEVLRQPAADCQPPDLVIASTPPLGLCAAAMKVARRCGAKFVCDIQDAWPETFERLLPRGFKWLGAILLAPLRATARRLYREADAVSGVCRRYAELSGRSDFYLAYHGIAGEVVTRRFDGGRRLVYAGNLGEGYDLDTVIEAVAARSELTLDIAGRGPRESRLAERVRALGIGDRVRFHGYLDDAALKALFANCDIGVVPMRDDSWVGLPYKLCDYLAAGLAVLSSLHGECGELLTKTGCGRTYDFGSSDSFLSALDSLGPTIVTLPDELRADEIYRRSVVKYAETMISESPCRRLNE